MGWAVCAVCRAAGVAAPRRSAQGTPTRRTVARLRARGGGPSEGRALAALVLGHDAGDLRATAEAVRASAGVDVVSLLHADADGLSSKDRVLALSEGPWEGCYALEGSGEDAAICGTDPGAGLVASLGYECVLCVVGVNREPNLGEDGAGGRTTRAARRAAVAGIPTVAVSIPTVTPGVPVTPATQALGALLSAATDAERGGVLDVGVPPANCPRSHFPFPSRARWAALGTSQFPVDESMRRTLHEARGDPMAAEDCWSLGASDATPLSRGRPGQAAAPDALRDVLRGAFRDADVFLALHVPPSWTPAQGFSACRPGVLWRQERVSHLHARPGASSGGEGGDLWGRSLPVQRLSDAMPTGKGAQFVPQLATDRLMASSSSSSSGFPTARGLPQGFVVGPGTIVADDVALGDVDAILRGKAAVVTLPSWPQGHPFALLDAALVETLRPHAQSGMPLWLRAE